MIVGTHIDLDGHFGNSIEGSGKFVPVLNNAILPGCKIDPSGEYGD
jgi:hypothetical protein